MAWERFDVGITNSRNICILDTNSLSMCFVYTVIPYVDFWYLPSAHLTHYGSYFHLRLSLDPNPMLKRKHFLLSVSFAPGLSLALFFRIAFQASLFGRSLPQTRSAASANPTDVISSVHITSISLGLNSNFLCMYTSVFVP